MDETNKEPTPEEPIVVNVINDGKQMRITIPAYIVENFHIDPQRHQFGWFIQDIDKDNQGKEHVVVLGKFLIKRLNDKKD